MKYVPESLTVIAWESASQAIILSEAKAKNRRIAMRHARAMLEVQRAAKAWAVAAVDVTQAAKTCLRLERAVDRLKQIEKEVSRGQ